MLIFRYFFSIYGDIALCCSHKITEATTIELTQLKIDETIATFDSFPVGCYHALDKITLN